jgi:hypothetical protein
MAIPFNANAELASDNVLRAVGLTIDSDPTQRSVWDRRLAATWGNGTRPEWKFGQHICRGCGHDIDATPSSFLVAGEPLILPVTVCDDCMALVRSHYDTQQIKKVASSGTPIWDEKCPPRMRECILGAMPAVIDAKALEKVRTWRANTYGAKGLALKGPSGSGKTTAYWALARELEAEGRTPVTLNAIELGRILSKAARDIEEVDWLCGCAVLMIDDLGKEKSTPAMAALLWEVLDKRYGRGLPLVITTRFSGAELRQRFGEECLGDDIVRRLNELCTGVLFALPSDRVG